jgi:hypothetical protein
MSYNTQELFQILNILTCSIYLWLVGALALGMEGFDVKRRAWVVITGLFYIARRDIKAFFKGKFATKEREGTLTEMYVAWTAVILGVLSFSFYWASVGLNLTNGTPNAFTTASNPNTQSWFIVGTILISFVEISFLASLVHWGKSVFG